MLKLLTSATIHLKQEAERVAALSMMQRMTPVSGQIMITDGLAKESNAMTVEQPRSQVITVSRKSRDSNRLTNNGKTKSRDR